MEYIEFLYRALDTPLGVVIETSDVELLRTRLYAARREAMNPDFRFLTFTPSRSDPKGALWIVRMPSNGQT